MGKIKTLCNLIRDNPKQISRAISENLAYSKAARFLPDAVFLRIRFRLDVGKRLSLRNPKTFNEKLQWIKLHDRRPEYNTMVDKYEAKKYVAEKIGSEYIIPTLGVWDNFDEIDFDALPNQFVLKCTHDSGSVVICNHKASFDMQKAKQRLQKKLQSNMFWYGREWPYKDLKPRIICEKYMEDESGTELKDYKVMCFNGEPKLIQIHRGRFENHTQDFYDTEWNKIDMDQGCSCSDVVMPKPEFLEQMLSLSAKLAAGIPHVRVDWYYAESRLYFGELTFFDASGFDGFQPEEYDFLLGSWIELPK